jgi:xylulokinase
MYTKSWSAFDRLVDIVPPGGSIGYCVILACGSATADADFSLDDKLFSFWFLQGDGFPFAHVKGIFRFETGIKVNEFRDLRANPRCLLESQILSFRVRWSRISSTGVFGAVVGRGGSSLSSGSTSSPPSQIPLPVTSSSALSLGLTFDPYDFASLPSRILATGAAANFPSVVNIIGDIMNAPILIPTTQIDGAQIVPHRNSPAKGYPSRASIGGAYVARWVWGRERGGIRVGGAFEDDIRKVLGKRWMMTGGLALKTSVNPSASSAAASAASTPGLAGIPGSASASRGGSGTNTPFSHHPRSGLGSTVFMEEDEEDIDINMGSRRVRMVTTSASTSAGNLISPNISSANSLSNSSLALTGINGQNPTSLATLDANSSPDPTGGSGSTDNITAPTSVPLTPVTAMSTSSDSDLQIGLAKVAEPDVDSFMGYAAIVPEYCRLEGMLVKGIV